VPGAGKNYGVFLDSREAQRLKARTRRGYEAIHRSVCARPTKAGTPLGDMPIRAWTVGAVRKFREARRQESESAAAAELRYIKRVFAWAVEYEHTESNPAKEVSLRGMAQARRYYVQDDDYMAALNMAPLKVALIAHLAYLTGRRRTDILNATRHSLRADGLFFAESKTDKEALIGWTEHLRQTVDLILEVAGGSLYLFPSNSRPDLRFTDSAMDNAWQKLRAALRKAGYAPFQFKDLRKKYATDLEAKGGDAFRSLLHSNRGLTDRHYVSKPARVVSIK